MKNLLIATLPALGLLALGGCATSGALTSTTESDGVYYSSADKTTTNSSLRAVQANRAVASSPNPDGYAYGSPAATATPAPASTDENANPDYYQGTVANNGIQGATGDYYVSNSYNPSSFGVPYTGPGVSYYNYAPATTAAYSPSPWSYSLGLGFGYGYPYYGGMYSPYAYSPYYDPFYGPYASPWYGYGSGFSLGFGYGYGGYGYGYPYYGGYGYGYPYYGYGYGAGYYSGYRSLGSARPGVYSYDGGGAVRVGPRGSRGTLMTPGNRFAAPAGSAPTGAGRRGDGGFTMGGLAPATGSQPAMNDVGNGRRGWNGPTAGQLGGMAPATPGTVGAPAAASRRGFFSGFFGNSGQMPQAQGGGGMAPQPAYAPRPGRSFDAPQPARSFDSPRYNAPSPSRGFGGGGFNGGGGGGGGSFGGGGGGGRRGR